MSGGPASTPEHERQALDIALAAPHHLLAVADDVTADEVEALAVSRSARAGWRAPNHLQLCAGASLTGPWRVDAQVRRVFDLPSWATDAYLLRCPVQRTGPLPDELRGTDELLDAFAQGLPESVEAEALEHLRAIARRLRGALRFAGNGAVIQPDPDAAVDLSVLAPVWLEPQACEQVLDKVLPGVRSLLEESATDPTGNRASADEGDRLSTEQHGPRAAAVEQLDPDERAWIHAEADAFDAVALRSEQVLTGYALGVNLDDRAMIEISVAGQEQVPTVLRSVEWARDGVITYELRWRPAEPEVAYSRRPPLAVRRRRAEAVALIERAALALQSVVGGEVCDDDGFLVAPETLA